MLFGLLEAMVSSANFRISCSNHFFEVEFVGVAEDFFSVFYGGGAYGVAD